jgi:hypothetical protein
LFASADERGTQKRWGLLQPGLRAWISGLQALICYWARRPYDSIRYAQRGTAYAQRAGNTAMVWLAASEARAWAVLGNGERAWDAINVQ